MAGKLNGLPVFYIKCDESAESKEGIDFISLVDCPAIEKNWLAFSKKAAPSKVALNSEKQILYGPILIPDLPIYRNDSVNGEHYVVFKAEEIQKLVRKFQKQQKTINLNYQHKDNSQIQEAVIQEIWLTASKDKSQSLGFNDLPENTAFVGAFIGDKDFWDNEVKTGNVKGFSIEGFLDMEMNTQRKFTVDRKKFEVYKQADGGSDVYIDGPIAVDSYVFSNYPSVVLVDGKKQVTQYPVWQELIVLEDGTILTLKDSKILKVEKKTTQSKTRKMSKKIFSVTAKAKDGTEITAEGEFAEGAAVTMKDASGNMVAVPDGEYEFDNGDKCTVKDGKIAMYKPADSEQMSEEEITAMKKVFGIDVLEAKLTKTEADLKAAQDQVKELQIKLKIQPAGKSATEKNDSDPGAGKGKTKMQIIREHAASITSK